MVVLLTVPHANCPPTASAGGHPCDIAAKKAARLIYRSKHNTSAEPPRTPSKTPRSECDLNRLRCRDHPWRTLLSERLDKGDVSFVLDVHSYPPYVRRWAAYEIIILDDTPSHRPFASYAVDFVRYMSRRDVRVGIGRGVNNDIQDEAREAGISSMLIEFNEALLRDRDRFAFIADQTARWLG